jgi:hypothetical protein
MNTFRLALLVWLIGCLAGLAAAGAEDGAAARPQAENIARGKTVLFGTPPNYPDTTDPEDVRQLVDGRLAPAVPMWYDKAVVGWVLVDPTVFTIDLGAIEPIRGVSLHKGAGQAGVEWPNSIEIYVSDDGERYSHVGNLMEQLVQRPPASGYAAFWLTSDQLQTHGRYVKFVCTPLNLGTGAYIMLDEVEIYRGEPEWLNRPLVWPPSPRQWQADWPQFQWRDQAAAVPHAERPRPLVLVDGPRQSGGDRPLQQAVVTRQGMAFTVQGEAGRPRSMFWTAPLPEPIHTAQCPYVVLTFRAQGFRRTYWPQPVVLLQGVNDQATGHGLTLLEANMVFNDGRRHSLIKRLPEGFTLRQLKVALFTEHDEASLVLERLELLPEIPAFFNPEIMAPGQAVRGLEPVDLRSARNGSLSGWFERVMGKHEVVLDGAHSLPAGIVQVSGIPFTIAPGEQNLILMPDTPEPNETVEFLGLPTETRNLGPISRADSLSVSVQAKAREAFLLLALAAPPMQVRGGLPYTALRLDDIENLAVDLTYDQGPGETAFPYSLADQGCYLPARALGAYAVAVDPTRRLRRITLRSHQFGLGFALAGVTLNTSDRPLVPQLVNLPAPERTARHPQPPPRPVAVTRQGQRLTVSNRWYEYSFDLSQGFIWDRLVHRTNSATRIKLGPASGLRVRVEDTIYTGRCFGAVIERTTPTTAELTLTSLRPELPLKLSLTLTAHDSPELTFVCRATNLGDQPLAAEVCLPALAGLSIGEQATTRLFFPQFRAVDTAEPIALRAPYGPEFNSQFMSVYSRPAGLGLMVRTDNHEQQMADFTLRKDAAGVSGGVCFPAHSNTLPPQASHTYPPVSLLAHSGDWHTAFTLYRDWLHTWYQPHKSQDEDYFLKAWNLQCYRPSDRLSWLEARVPPIISRDRKQHFVDETFAFEKQRLGHVPDLIHFFNWTYNDQKQRNEYGVFGTPWAYEQVGGLEFFRTVVSRIQDHWGRPLSLYTLVDRFRASALPDQALAEELAATARYKALDNDASAALRAAGPADGIFFPPLGTERWADFFIEDITRMQRETGCQMVYVDVFPHFSHLRGGPGVTPRQDDLKVVKRLRDALPDEVALWTEYPFTDYTSQYADGCLQYYFLELNQTFARRYNTTERAADLFAEMPLNVGRYALPRYRTFCLAAYIEASRKPSQVDAVFVNGEPFHEDTFRLLTSRPRAKLNRAYVVKHEYADCFSSDRATPWVDTAAAGITANLFPGRNRNLWTLHNGRPRTYSGVVLTVPHRPGAKYRDAWQGTELTPVIKQGLAYLTLTLGPQQPGCVVQDFSP